MLNKVIVRKFTLDDCRGYKATIGAALALTDLRIERLKNTQAKNPGWAAYDKYADDIVGIDIRIEEQEAVKEELEEDLGLLFERDDIINQAAAYAGITPNPGEPAIQLGFFDTAKKRERMGVLC